MISMLLYGVILIIGIIIILITIIFVRSYLFHDRKEAIKETYKPSPVMTAANKLSEAIKIQTISYLNTEQTDWDAFRSFHKLLEKQFPKLHDQCERTIINQYSLVYHWKSNHLNSDKKPILITAHMDVVPVEEETENDWVYPPYDGRIADGYVWGRGALDIKIHLIAIMEAMEQLIKEGVTPDRDIYMAFGHDEEIDGMQGAYQIADYFAKQGLTFELVLDEGGFVSDDILEGINKPIALLGIGEKGFANIRLAVTREGSHASMPAKHSSLGILAQALCRLEKYSCKPKLIPPVKEFLNGIGPYMKGMNHVIISNLWLFQPLFLKFFSKTNIGGALLKTTVAVTMAQGSPAPNVIPQKSSAVINCRILPGETGNDLMKYLKKVLKGLPVVLEPLVLDEPSKISRTDTDAYSFLEKLIQKYCKEAVVVPYLVMASTDARKYEAVSENIFRFTPFIIQGEDTDRIHGTNERISIENINRCVDFFMDMIRSC